MFKIKVFRTKQDWLNNSYFGSYELETHEAAITLVNWSLSPGRVVTVEDANNTATEKYYIGERNNGQV